MEGEVNKFIKAWLWIIACQCYCYVISKTVSNGFYRLAFFLPIVCLFLAIPLNLSSVNLSGGTAFFISWLGTSKLLLFAFAKGPLASDPQISLSHFLLISCLPIQIRQKPNSQKWPKYFPFKLLLFVILFPLFDRKEHFHPKVNLVFLCLFIYLLLDIILALAAAAARAVLGLELEPHFDEPYLATSLQDFWGRRWNLVVSRVLRPTVYEPGLFIWAGVMGRKWAPIPAVVGTFVVSGLAHELIYFYLGRVAPTWEVMWFFVLHGLCLAVEMAVKKALAGAWRIPAAVSRPVTVGFVILSSSWLFFPQFIRCKADVRLIHEYTAFGRALKSGLHKFVSL